MGLAAIKRALGVRLARISGLSTKTLTGTLTKAAASTTLTGSGTLFTQELRIGSVISVPGTAVEYFVVTAIAGDTSLTVHVAAAYNASAQTATQIGVWIDEPDTTPTNEQCPCVIAALPRISPSMPVSGLGQAIHHFEILYLYKPFELALPQEATSAMDAYLSDVWTTLFGSLLLAGTAGAGDFDGEITRPLIQFRQTWFWAYKIPWKVVEHAEITVTP